MSVLCASQSLKTLPVMVTLSLTRVKESFTKPFFCKPDKLMIKVD